MSIDSTLEEEVIKENSSTMKCTKCDLKFRNKLDLKQHIEEVHIIIKVYACLVCDHKTTIQKENRIHVDTMHRSVQIRTERLTTEKEFDKGKEIKCSNCEYKCSLNIQLRRHQQLKHAEHIAKAPKLVTEEGNQGTGTKANLQSIFSCDKCDYDTENSKEIKDHIDRDIHNVLNQNKTINESTNLQRKQSRCGFCEYQTKEITELKEHESTKHGVVH